MATYVNDLRLKEIATGDEAGTWGTSTNTNLELIAEAFSFGTEAITTNADTHTTTIADGSTDPGRSMFLKYTGTLDSACTITIGPNTVSKFWFIENATSGSQNIIISQGSGANITIPPGDTKAIYSDGAGSGAAMVDAFASLNVVDLKVQDDLTVTDDLIVNGDIDLEGSIDVNGTANLDVVDIDGAVDMATTLQVTGNLTTSGNNTFTVANNTSPLTLVSTDADANGGPFLDLWRNSSSPADGDVTGVIRFYGENDNDEAIIYGKFLSFIRDASDGSEDGTIQINHIVAGTERVALELDNDEYVFNNAGIDVDFRVESNAHTNMFFIDGGNDGIGIGNSTIIDWSTNYPGLQMGQAGALYGHKSSNQMNFAMNWGVTTGNVYIADGIASRMIMDTTKISFDSSASGSAGGAITGINILQMTTSGSVFNEDSGDLDFRVESNGNANMLFVDGGEDHVNIGTTSDFGDTFNVSGAGHFSANVTLSRQSNDTGSTGLAFEKTRSTSVNGNTVVQNGDQLGFVAFRGNDGDQFIDGAYVISFVDGTPGNNDMPTSLQFWTTADGASSPTARMVINNKGSVGIGVADGDVTNDGTAARTYVGIIGTANRGRLNIGSTASNGADAGTLSFTNGANSLADLTVDTTSGVQNTGTLFVNGTRSIKIQAAASDEVVFNESGADVDFRVESDGKANMFGINAGSDFVYIGADEQVQNGDLSMNAVSASPVIGMLSRSTTDGHQATILLQQTNATSGNFTATGDGRGLGLIGFRGVDSAGTAREGGGIRVEQDGAAVSGAINGQMTFRTRDVDRMTITSAGAVNISGSGSGTEQFRVGNSGGGTDFGIFVTENSGVVLNAAEGSTGRIMEFAVGGTSRMQVQANGQFSASTDGSFSSNKNYTFRDGVGIDNPNSSSYSTSTSATLCVGAMSTGRSINATGTINASGADYAEYMYKADGCGTIAKGDVVGVDTHGKLTTVFSDAISFVIKSTDPSYVGGDKWADEEPPTKDEEDTTEWDSWYARTETKRATVDRIAFSGQVPVNITGSFNVGDYVYPEADGNGIKAVAKSSPTFEEYQLCVGKIWATEEDGRPFVAVKIG